MNKSRFSLFIALVFVVAAPFSLMANGAGQAPMQGTEELVILHTNDTHGHPLNFFNYPAPNVGGLPAIATLTMDTRDMHENVLVLDAGDLNTGRPESNFFEAASDIIGYNYVGYDAMALGNHEFDKPLSTLEKQQRMANFPFISANVYDSDGLLLYEPYVIKKFDNLTVGIFGLTTTETPVVTSPDITGNLVFEDEVDAAQRVIAELEPQVDVIIALAHLGLYDDENLPGSRRLAANVEGIDLIIDGHSHTKLDEAVIVNGTPIVTAWQWGLYVGKAVLTITDGEVVDFAWEPIPVNLKNATKDDEGETVYTFVGMEIEEDPFLLNALTPYYDQVEVKLTEVIGYADGHFENEEIRLKEAALGNMVADAMLWATKSQGADFAIQNGGGIRADIPEGDINKKLIYEVLPFDNSVKTVDMSGAQVQAMFDFVATIPRGKGGFPQVSDGVSFTVDFTTGQSSDILINGQPIDPNATYKVATNSFMAAGGDGYSMMEGYQYDTSAYQRDVVIDYIQSMDAGVIAPATFGRITVIE